MPTGDVSVGFSGQEADLIRALEKSERRFEKLEKKVKGINTQNKRAGKSFKEAFGQKAVTQVKSLVTAMGLGAGLAGVVRLVSSEYRNLIEVQRTAASVVITLSQARKNLFRNLAGKDEATLLAAIESAGTISRATGVRESITTNALAEAVSASGQNVPASVKAVRGAARSLADSPGKIAGFAGSLLDLGKVTGSEDADVNRGLLLATSALSRVSDPRQAAMNIPRSLINQKVMGATTSEAAALFAALSVAGADFKGSITANATIRYGEQLRDFFRDDKKLTQQALDYFGREATTGERQGLLQRNTKIAKKFLKGASFDAAASGLIEDLLLKPGSVAATEYQKALGGIGSNEELAALARQSIKDRDLDPLEEIAKAERAFKVAAETLSLRNMKGARASVARAGVKSVLQAAEISALDQTFIMGLLEFETGFGRRPGVDPIVEGVGIIENRGDVLERGPSRAHLGGGAFRDSASITHTRGEPSARDLDRAEGIREVLVALEELLVEAKKTSESTAAIGNAGKKQPTPGTGANGDLE